MGRPKPYPLRKVLEDKTLAIRNVDRGPTDDGVALETIGLTDGINTYPEAARKPPKSITFLDGISSFKTVIFFSYSSAGDGW